MNLFPTYIPIIKDHSLRCVCGPAYKNTLALLNYENFVSLQDAAKTF